MTRPAKAENGTTQLCPSCGLCCNGVLFADVELRRVDAPERLAGLGLTLHRKGRARAFAQPCSCFDGQLCRIYPERPARCRTFECGLLHRVQAGELRAADARREIARVRRQADQVRQLLRDLGNKDEAAPLTRRYAAVMAQPIDLAEDESRIELRAALMLEVGKLMQVLQRRFLG